MGDVSYKHIDANYIDDTYMLHESEHIISKS